MSLGDGTATPASSTFDVMPQASVPLLQEDELKAEYWKTHCDPGTIRERNGGCHFFYLEEFLKRNGGGQGWIVGTELSIAGQCQGEGLVWSKQKGRPVEGMSQQLGGNLLRGRGSNLQRKLFLACVSLPKQARCRPPMSTVSLYTSSPADIFLFDITDMHTRIFGSQFTSQVRSLFPALQHPALLLPQRSSKHVARALPGMPSNYLLVASHCFVACSICCWQATTAVLRAPLGSSSTVQAKDVLTSRMAMGWDSHKNFYLHLKRFPQSHFASRGAPTSCTSCIAQSRCLV